MLRVCLSLVVVILVVTLISSGVCNTAPGLAPALCCSYGDDYGFEFRCYKSDGNGSYVLQAPDLILWSQRDVGAISFSLESLTYGRVILLLFYIIYNIIRI